MQLWYAICDLLPMEMLRWEFMRNALLAIVIMAPLFGILSTLIVTGRMSFFSDALGHSAFTGIAIGCICGLTAPIWAAVAFSVVFSLLFSYVRSRSNQAADTLIGVFSSAAVALGIFVATLGGGSFTKYNKYLIGDILSVTPIEIGLLALVLVAVAVLWVLFSNRLTLTVVHPQLAASRGISTTLCNTLFSAAIVVVIAFMVMRGWFKGWVGLTAATLIMSGGVGNLIDRVAFKFVTDMLETTFIQFPVFNFADCCITVGVVLLFIYTLFIWDDGKKKGGAKDGTDLPTDSQ